MTAAQPETASARYLLDKRTSRFTVRAFASGLLSAMGHSPVIAIRDFTGEGRFDPAHPDQTSLRLEISAHSLEVADDIKSSDRREIESTMKGSVLESSTYPTIVFDSAESSADQVGEGRFRVAMKGNLSLRGLTRALTVPAQVILTGDMLRAFGQFSILQSNFGIPAVSVAGGALKLKDELKLSFDIVARKQE